MINTYKVNYQILEQTKTHPYKEDIVSVREKSSVHSELVKKLMRNRKELGLGITFDVRVRSSVQI